MKTLICRIQPTFASGFIHESEQMMNTLTFITKDEYLVWVKKWKEDFKLVERHHKIEKYSRMKDSCKTPTKKDYYQKKLDKLTELTKEETEKVASLMFEMQKYSEMNAWFKSSYWLAIYFLVQRKASKLRANSQWILANGKKLIEKNI